MTKLEELWAAWEAADAAYDYAYDASVEAWRAYQEELEKQEENSYD
jgi:hypothetical protein